MEFGGDTLPWNQSMPRPAKPKKRKGIEISFPISFGKVRLGKGL